MLSFGYHHYIPALRTKQGEFKAIRELEAADRELLTPLWDVQEMAEPIDDEPTFIDDHLKKIPKQLAFAWPNKPAFIDLEAIPPDLRMRDGAHPLDWLLGESTDKGAVLVPVTGLDRDAEYDAAALRHHARYGTGIAIRVTAERITNGPEIAALVAELGLPPNDLDLIVDLELADSTTLGVIGAFLPLALNALSAIRNWRTFTLLGGSFPERITGTGIIRHDRPEFTLWSSLVTLGPPALARKPSYGDYAVQNPVSSQPPRFAMASAAIRYTDYQEWYIFRGQSINGRGAVAGLGFAQYRQLADHCRNAVPPYRGSAYSAGDTYIEDCANGGPTGNNTTWRFVGTNQHVVFSARSVAAIP
ncbi:MAG: beta family protein [Candidatus Eremiobacteraeota bacterium]|nr:beta family protein [Candidatus Eremiobacteraeota bacterium]